VVTSYVAMAGNTNSKPELNLAVVTGRLPGPRWRWLSRSPLLCLGSSGIAHDKTLEVQTYAGRIQGAAL